MSKHLHPIWFLLFIGTIGMAWQWTGAPQASINLYVAAGLVGSVGLQIAKVLLAAHERLPRGREVPYVTIHYHD